jgi:hypothetical protein
MKKLGMLGIISGAALLTVAPFSLQWSQDEASVSLNSVRAQQLTETGIVGGHRRAHRRIYRGERVVVRTVHWPYPPPGGSYYVAPFASVNAYDDATLSRSPRRR